jgi:hypothetical protein
MSLREAFEGGSRDGGLAVRDQCRPPAVVEAQIPADGSEGLAYRAARPEAQLLILDRAPQAFDVQQVPPAAAASHADSDFLAARSAGEGDTGELTALVRTESLRRPKACRHFPQGLYTKVCLGLDRQPPC